MTCHAPFYAEFVRKTEGWTLADDEFGLSGSHNALSAGTLIVFADARIDDRANLCSLLGLPVDADPSQIILTAYRAWGDGCVDRLLGDFAFVIFDREADRIFCARDFVGARPLFYHEADRTIRISNDLGTLISRLPQPCPINTEHVARKLAGTMEHYLAETGFGNVWRVPQAHWRSWTGDETQNREYWSAEMVPHTSLSEDAAIIAEGRRLVQQAISDRLHGADQAAVHVSGGLDSSLIAAILRKEIAQRGLPDARAFAWFGNATSDRTNMESTWVRAMAERLDMPICVPPVTEAGLMRLMRQDGLVLIEPGTLFYEAPVMEEAARGGVDVVFSGWGGDQGISFNGKGHRAALLLSLRWPALARLGDGVRPGLIRGIRKALKELLPLFPARDWQRKLRKSYLADPASAGAYRVTAIRFRAPGTRARIAEAVNSHGTVERIEAWAQAGREKGLTYVYPLLDKRVVEFALSLPGDRFVRPGCRRWIFREIAAPFLPDLVRGNDSKNEPNRIAALMPVLGAVFQKLANEVRNCELDERAQLVDLHQLANEMQNREGDMIERLFAKRQAIQILNLAQHDD